MSDHGKPKNMPAGTDTVRPEDLLHSIDGIVWEADAATFQFSFVSEKAVQLLGYPLSEWYSSGEFWLNAIHPDDRTWAIEFCQAATSRGEDHQFEYRMIAADGRIVWLKDIVSIVDSGDGRKILRGVMFDITEQKKALEDLDVLQRRLEATLEHTPNVAIQWYDENGVVQYWNPASERIFGWTAEEALGKTLDATIHTKEETEEFHTLLKKVAETGMPDGPMSHSFRRKDGTIGFCSSTIFQIPGKESRPYFVCMDVDITEQITAETERLELLFNLGERVKELSALHSVARILQQPDVELDKALREIVAMLPHSMQEPLYAEARIKIGDLSEESENFPPEGRSITSSFSTNDGRVGSVEVAYQDAFNKETTRDIFLDEERSMIATISEMLRVFYDRRLSEQKLKESEERFRQLAENVKEVFWMHSTGVNEMIYVSPAYESVWGRSLKEVYENPRSFIDPILPEDQEHVIENLKKGSTTGFESEYRIQLPDGSIKWIWDRGFPVKDENGEVYRVAGLAEDITQRKRLEEQLLRSQKLEAVGQLAGGIAHDFNNLLTAIIGYSDLILRKIQADDPIVRHVEEIRRSGNRAAALTRQLLAFSRKQILQPKQIDLNEVITDIEQILHRLIGDNINVNINLDPLIGTVKADPVQLEQVIINLAINARDAMPNGGRLSIETGIVNSSQVKEWSENGGDEVDLVEVRVSDTGTGIEPEDLERIFEPFYTTKEIGKGSGLGLSTVYGIVQQSGGVVMVESEPGAGSVFSVYVPRTGPSADSTGNTSDAAAGGLRQIRVLLVEDEEVVAGMISRILEDDGFNVSVAGNGTEAIELIDKIGNDLDLLITDMRFPNGSGSEIAAKLKLVNPDAKIIFMSGYLEKEMTDLRVGNDEAVFIQKPFDPKNFSGIVRSICGQDEEN